MAGPAGNETLYLLHLDRHHLGDALFLQTLAQQFAQADSAPACLLVHGSGEKVEHTLESQGYFPERTGGVLDVETEEQRRLVERAVREMNHEIVAALTDEVVSTVGIQGVDRGLIRRSPGGTIRASGVGWLAALVKQHVVPVVSALVEDEDSGVVEEVPAIAALMALAEALDESFEPVGCVLTTTDRPGVPDDGDVHTEASAEVVTEEIVAEPATVQSLVDGGIPTLVTTLRGLLGGDDPQGTHIRSSGDLEGGSGG